VSQAGGAIVIGAGLAGLTAAISLLEEGWQVEVIEARGRVGGRTWSKPLDSGAVIEMGAEFILPGSTAVRELASGLGLDLWDKGVRYANRQPRGDGFDDSSSDRAIADRLPTRELISALLEPVGPFAFAGEHTAGEYCGLMEGAVRSGRTAAERLVRTAE